MWKSKEGIDIQGASVEEVEVSGSWNCPETEQAQPEGGRAEHNQQPGKFVLGGKESERWEKEESKNLQE